MSTAADPIARHSLHEVVTDRVRDLITEGAFPPRVATAGTHPVRTARHFPDPRCAKP